MSSQNPKAPGSDSQRRCSRKWYIYNVTLTLTLIEGKAAKVEQKEAKEAEKVDIETDMAKAETITHNP